MTFPVAFKQRQEVYLGANRRREPKQAYRFLVEKMRDGPLPGPGATLVDFGCATGAMIEYLRSEFPDYAYLGLDNVAAFIEEARSLPALEGVAFELADAFSYRGGPFDLVVCFGVFGIPEDFEALLESLLANTKPGGRLFAQGLFNEDDIDVRMVYRDNLNGQDWNTGFNLYSQARVSAWLAGRCESHAFHRFVMPFDVPKRDDMPHRARTMTLADGERRMVNGMSMILPEFLLEVRR